MVIFQGFSKSKKKNVDVAKICVVNHNQGLTIDEN